MNIDIIIVLSILLIGFILFLMEYFTIDVTALIILAAIKRQDGDSVSLKNINNAINAIIKKAYNPKFFLI